MQEGPVSTSGLDSMPAVRCRASRRIPEGDVWSPKNFRSMHVGMSHDVTVAELRCGQYEDKKLTNKHDASCCDRSPLPANLVHDQAQADHAGKEPCHLGVVQGVQE